MAKTALHSPTLESVKMVERTIEECGDSLGKYQMWKRLPKKMMYQTYLQILDYLEESGKIVYDRVGHVVWVWNPELVRKYWNRDDLRVR